MLYRLKLVKKRHLSVLMLKKIVYTVIQLATISLEAYRLMQRKVQSHSDKLVVPV